MKAEAGAVLPLDAGNALFERLGAQNDDARKKADLIVSAMAQMGVQAMAVGLRDLAVGPDFVSSLAGKHGIAALSANLARDGKLLYAPSRLLTVGGLRIAVIGASPPGALKVPGVTGLPLQETVLKEAKRLRPQADLVVVLAAVPYADALQLATDGRGVVDLVLQSHESRGVGPGVPIAVAENFVVHTGERGRQVARLDLELGGKGPLTDASQAQRSQQTLKILDRQMGQVRQRIAAAKDEASKKSYQATLQRFEARRAEVAKAASETKPGGRALKLSYTTLTPDLPSDPALEARVSTLDKGH